MIPLPLPTPLVVIRAWTLGWILASVLAVVPALTLVGCAPSGPAPTGPASVSTPPAATSNPALDAPIDRWDEAIPLGNGLTGGLLWGGNDTLRLSLDRGDLWDLRRPESTRGPKWSYANMQRLQRAGLHDEHIRVFDNPYDRIAYPTKIPAGRIELDLGGGSRLSRFQLDLAAGKGHAETAEGGRVDVFYSAQEPIAMLLVRGQEPTVRLLPAAAIEKLGNRLATVQKDENHLWFLQNAAKGLSYSVVVGWRKRGADTQIAIAIESSVDGDGPVARGIARVDGALDRGYDQLLKPHEAWWQSFWSASSIEIPDSALQRHYNFVKYLYGAGSREGAPPLPLQGVWTADGGSLPPWKGDYHNDLNTQMTYQAVHTAGLLGAGQSFLDFNWDLLPRYREFADQFYDVEGAVIPGVMALDGRALGGWGQYSLSPTNGAWVAQSFYAHWRHTLDQRFLRERAYPFSLAVAKGLAGLLKPGEDGFLDLPLSTSPEIHDNSPQAWLAPNSNYDQALIAWLFGAVGEMAGALGDSSDSKNWAQLAANLGPLDTGIDGALTFAAGEPLEASHRHHSHLMSLHPLGTLDYRRTEDRAIIDASLDRTLGRGTQAWVGYSFSWMSALLARAGRANAALQYLRDFERAFTLRNGFHANGDQIGAGLSRFRYRPFTLEGNMLAMTAVHEMLLQSHGGLLSIYPAVSQEWADVSFANLRAEGGLTISAERRAGQTNRVAITAAQAGPIRMENPFPLGAGSWSAEPDEVGPILTFSLARGQTLIGSASPTSESLRD